jgi:purine nucleosidase
MKRKLIIDTDCGSDDAIALAMALHDERYEIMMITTVSGNVRVHQATANVLTTLKIADSYHPPVYAGRNEMLKRDWVGAADTHGNDGLSDLGFPDGTLRPQEGDAVQKIIEMLNASPEKEIDLIALGPLTNIAAAILQAPDTMKKVHRLVAMGSSGFTAGNVTPAAEFNVWQDAEACKIVLESGIEPLVFVGWDACLDETMLNSEEIRMIKEANALGRFCIEANSTLLKLNQARFGYDCLDLADPVAMAVALYPECIDTCDKYYCDVETCECISYGSFIIDRFAFSGKAKNAYVCTKVKADLFKQYLFERLSVKNSR